MSTFSFNYGDREPGSKLTLFIDSDVNPDAQYLADCGEFTDLIVHFMHNVSPFCIESTIKVIVIFRLNKRNVTSFFNNNF